MRLPCSTEHWEAETAQAWAALHPWTGLPPSLSLRETLDELITKELHSDEQCAETSETAKGSSNMPRRTVLQTVLDEYHRMLVATTLIRSVWDLRESLNAPMMTFAGPNAETALPRNMDAVLSILNKLTTNALVPAAASMRPGHNERRVKLLTQREFKGFVLRARVSLIAQIIAVDGVTDHLSLAGTDRRNVSEATEQRLLAWGRADPSQARKLVYVGARLLAISRLYPYHYPREPFDALQGGMLVWTMLRLLKRISAESDITLPVTGSFMDAPTPLSMAGPHARGPQRVCQLDWLGADDAPEPQAVWDWIHQGGDQFVLRMHGISDMSTTDGERQVLCETASVLRGLQVWGVSRTYLDIVTRALQNDNRL